MIAAGQSLFKTLSPLIGIRDSVDNPNPPIGTTDQRITPRVTIDQFLTPIYDPTKDGHIGLSRYASVESEEESTDSVEIQRRSLGPRGANLLRKKFNRNEAEAQAGKPPAMQFMDMVE